MVACSTGSIRLGSPGEVQIDRSMPREISSERCGFQLLLVFPIYINGRHKRVWSDLESQAGDDYISDVQVQEYWRYGLIGTFNCTKLVANAYPRL
jgi:hypothetical protein